MRCSNCFNCSGNYRINTHEPDCKIWTCVKRKNECTCRVKSRTWVIAHELPVWVQCSQCGVVPGLKDQGAAIRQVLEEIVNNIRL